MKPMDLTKLWSEYTYVAFDTETSGAYPLGAEIVEFGAVKWRAGQEIAEYQTLLKPTYPMGDFIIGIHGITNEMVASAPVMADKIHEINDFLKDAVLIAHHAPFDMGFLTVDYEKNKMTIPTNPVLCTSLLSRQLIKESANHKLQTLIKLLNLHQGTAHRALDDARACLGVGLECMRRMGPQTSLQSVVKKMGKPLDWNFYSLHANRDERYKSVVEAILNHKDLDIIYEGGSLRGQSRRISPIGVVRNPDGDYVMAICHIDRAQKRFYINKIKDASLVF